MGIGMIGTVFFLLGFLMAGFIAILVGALFALSLCKTLKEILRSSPGSERLELEIFTKDRNRVVMQCDFTLKATQEILSQVQNLLGIQNVQQIIRKIEPEKREEPAWKKNRRSWKRDSDS